MSDIYLQLILAVVLGSLMGFERRLAHKTAGMRTFALVTLGAAVFSIMSQSVGDAGRIASGIVTGIGFLGAGLIILRHNNGEEERVWGLTTAAGLWVAAAVGMAIGFRYYEVAILTALLTIFVFAVMWIFEERFVDSIKKK